MSTQARLRDELTGIWQEIFEVPADEIDPDDSLFAAGGTSLQAVQLMTRIEEAFGVALPLTVVFAEGSVNRLTELVEEGLLAAIEDLSEEEALRLLHEQQTAPGA
ncbi:acyl carrier protein [Streptomyces sp. KR80]|uniref:acyl carrier protein n=1 Tax=Streptomyces sp. KR80 TaxID=3457426 RepID=UPI003FD34F47